MSKEPYKNARENQILPLKISKNHTRENQIGAREK